MIVAAAQGTLTRVQQIASSGSTLVSIALDPGYPSFDLLNANTILLGALFDPATGELASNRQACMHSLSWLSQ